MIRSVLNKVTEQKLFQQEKDQPSRQGSVNNKSAEKVDTGRQTGSKQRTPSEVSSRIVMLDMIKVFRTQETQMHPTSR